ncbi:PTS sugar transporter subunit IIA [Neobacillus sp. MM2021_6]|uniref:PTS sugar transporter subunit IIA n=1 Tax=Bacillaceae TaxID=186817 RepID=UPI001409B9BD|nr:MULTISPECIES: PTS sugar transporter subunit IIA [Bacillaceae]MBO0958681.1 PTS sugar transporter subunit IIA [Neobacillus sp. MM2021_6]NHC18224.1 PTS sugar transporter subunit IIA [Bacillus sp. MM2020_4]
MFFDKKITFFDLEATDREDALRQMAESLQAAELVSASFEEGIIKREETFPTGLAVEPYGVAIPHTDADKVFTPQIAFASLKNPVKFQMMGNGQEEVDVSLIFMLALKKAEDQLTMLQRLMGIFQDQALLTEFAACKNQCQLEGLLSRVGLE